MALSSSPIDRRDFVKAAAVVGEPRFDVRFLVLDELGRHSGVTMYHRGETRHALATGRGAESPELEPRLEGAP